MVEVSNTKAPASVIKDSRFQKVHNDPRFARVNKKKTKLQIDKRFAAALHDEKFQGAHAKYDKYGRRLKDKQSELSRFYRLEEAQEEEQQENEGDDDEEGEENQPQTDKAKAKGKAKAKAKAKAKSQPQSDSDEDDEDEDEQDPELSRLEYLNRMARGELSSSEEESSSDSDDDDEEEVVMEDADDEEAKPKEDIPMGEETKRFAVLNCDWTRIRAVDIFALCQSFAPETGAVLDVTVYPSDYGLEKMKEEEQYGPQMLLEASKKKKEDEEEEEEQDDKDTSNKEDNKNEESDDEKEAVTPENDEVDDQDDQDGDEPVDGADDEEYDSDDPLQVKKRVTEDDLEGFDKEKLREYELQKLRYYYAVVTCDSVKTASAIFDQCDQMEYEASANVLDLRFVPDDVIFSNPSRDSCQQVPDQYKPVIFATSALQQTDVKLTWEADDQQRRELLTRPTDWKTAGDDDFAAYIASENSSEEDEDEDDEEDEDKEKDKPAKREDKKKRKVDQLKQRYRNMLLGSDAEDAADNEDDDDKEKDSDSDAAIGSDSEEGVDDLKIQVAGVSSGDEEEDDGNDGNMEMSFTPGAADILKAKKLREKQANETPYERYQREKKELKNKKAHDKRNKQKQLQKEQREQMKLGKRKTQQAKKAQAQGIGAEERDEEEDARDFDMKAIAKREKLGQKKLSNKRKAKEMRKLAAQGAALQETFSFDAQDPRFAALYAQGGDFAIDPTDPKFKKTQASEEIFKQRRKRMDEQQQEPSSKAPVALDESSGSASNGGDLKQMVAKLKRKHKDMDAKPKNRPAVIPATGKSKKMKKHV